jgi:hypothetical protein
VSCIGWRTADRRTAGRHRVSGLGPAVGMYLDLSLVPLGRFRRSHGAADGMDTSLADLISWDPSVRAMFS